MSMPHPLIYHIREKMDILKVKADQLTHLKVKTDQLTQLEGQD